jgi:hypothetical protein
MTIAAMKTTVITKAIAVAMTGTVTKVTTAVTRVTAAMRIIAATMNAVMRMTDAMKATAVMEMTVVMRMTAAAMDSAEKTRVGIKGLLPVGRRVAIAEEEQGEIPNALFTRSSLT